jgi:putative heme-binding domain-containing protein
LTFALLLLAASAFAADEKPFGLERRIPWTTSRVIGSPDPPRPYTVQRTFTNLTWKAPLYLAPEPGTASLLVVEQGGDAGVPSRIHRLRDDPQTTERELLLAMTNRLIYGLTFHPGYATNGQLFVFSNGPWGKEDRTNRISRFTVARAAPHPCDPASEQIIIEWRSAGHDGGDLAFGLDGMLYISSGDGTSDSDGWVSGQDVSNLPAAVLRIDVDHPDAGRAYSVPPDNPFLRLPGARPEIWAYGLRNPWRLTVDRRTGHVWVGNNGQDLWETAHLVRRAENYGWSVYEGGHPFYLHRPRGPTPIVKPTLEHPHSEFRSLTGGVVYYGEKHPELNGVYLYGDHSTGKIWGARHDGARLTWHRELADTALQIAAFGVDQCGELLIADLAGGLYRLVPTPKDLPKSKFPTRLSETGLFKSVKGHQVEPALIPYSVNAPGWADGAEAERFLALPGDAKISYTGSRGWNFPDGTVLVQTLSLEMRKGDPRSRRRIETRLLTRQQGEWVGYSYRWNDAQTDATLVPAKGDELRLKIQDPSTRSAGSGAFPPLPVAADVGRRHLPAERWRALTSTATNSTGSIRFQTWRFPSRAECMACHSRAANFVLGLTEAQMNREHDYGRVCDNQLRTLEHIGLFTAPLPNPPDKLTRLTNPYDTSADLDARARSYLHANCSVCHIEAGGGNAKLELEFTTDRRRMNLLGARPQHDSFGLPNAMLVAPAEPDRSVLVARLSRRGQGQMPPLVTSLVDPRAVQLFRDWIARMQPDRPFVRDWQMSDLLPLLDQVKAGRSFESGMAAFRAVGCIQCHRFAGEGGSVGPDLTGVRQRLSARDLLESILEPSKLIAEAYAATELETKDGELITGRVEHEDAKTLTLRTHPQAPETTLVRKADLKRRTLSTVSNMPIGVVNVLRAQEVLDLLAYLLADGHPQEEAFISNGVAK